MPRKNKPRAPGGSNEPPRSAAGVSSYVMCAHLGLAPPYLDKLVADNVIERRPDGKFDLDAVRISYIRHLRLARRTSPAIAAQAEFAAAKARDLQIKNALREGKLMETEEAIAIIDELMGIMLAALSGLAARVTRDVEIRRAIEAEIFNLRQELAAKCAKRAAELEKESIHDRHARNDTPRGNRSVRRPRIHGVGSAPGQTDG